MLLLKLLFLHEGNLSQIVCSTMVGMFTMFSELLPCPIHCGIVPAAAKEEFSNYASVLDGNHNAILASCHRHNNS